MPLALIPGGAAGAVSRITGTLGKGIAALTMDEKYKQERRQEMGKKPVNVKEGLTRGGKGLFKVRGVFIVACRLLHSKNLIRNDAK